MTEFTLDVVGGVDDYHQMLDVFEAAFEDADHYGRAHRPDNRSILDRVRDPGTVFLLAKDASGNGIGALAAYVLRKYEQEMIELYLYDLGVVEGFRRKGVARALIGKLAAVGRELGASLIFVQADKDEDDRPAQALYRTLGAESDVFQYDINLDQLLPRAGRRHDQDSLG